MEEEVNVIKLDLLSTLLLIKLHTQDSKASSDARAISDSRCRCSHITLAVTLARLFCVLPHGFHGKERLLAE